MRDLFRHRQTMAGAVRFSTDELANLASRIAEAGEHALAWKQSLFDEMAALALEHARAPGRHRRGAGGAGCRRWRWANWRWRQRYVRPKIDNGLAFKIVRGRHPVVEAALAADHAAAFRRPMIAIFRRKRRAVCGWSPAPTWRANPPSCARTR